MKQVTAWWEEMNGEDRRWLLIGKGPSFEKQSRFDLGRYTTIGINHVARMMHVDVTSIVNYEVLADCGAEIARNSRYLLMPRFPHSIPGDHGPDLETYFDTFPFLERLSRDGRLIWYNLSSDPVFRDPLASGTPHQKPFIVENGSFSVCILFNLLGALGARQVRTLGIDGGRSYAPAFADMEASRKLANGIASYDFQFEDMTAAVKRYGLDYAPLTRAPLTQRLRMLAASPARKKAIRRFLRRVPLFASTAPP
jgi:hypothetical protein